AMRAASIDLANFAYESASEHLQRAVALMDQMRSAAAQTLCAALIDLGRALLNCGKNPEAFASFERALGLARDRGDVEALVDIALGLTGTIQATVEYYPGLIALLEELIERLRGGQPNVLALLISRLLIAMTWHPDQAKKSALEREAHA